MKVGMILCGLVAAAMTGPVEERKTDECQELYEGKLVVMPPFSDEILGVKMSSGRVEAYGGKLLELTKEETKVEVVFSKCKNKHEGVLSVKGEKDECVLYTPRKGFEEYKVLYVGDCKKTSEELFQLSEFYDNHGRLEALNKDYGRTLYSDLIFFDIEGEKNVTTLVISNETRYPTSLMLEITKEL